MRTAKRPGLLLILLLLILPSPIHSATPPYVRYRDSSASAWTDEFDASTAKECDIEISLSEDGVSWTDPIPTTVFVRKTRDSSFHIKWNWQYEEDVDSFRYRIDGGDTGRVAGDKRSLISGALQYNKLTIFEIRAERGDVLSEPVMSALIALRRKPDNGPVLRLYISPYLLKIVDFYNGHSVPDAKYLTLSRYGFSIGMDAGYSFNRNLVAYIGSGYSLALKKETVLPDAISVHHARVVAGLDYTFLHNKDFSAGVGLFGGGMLHVNGNFYNLSSVFGMRLLTDWRLDDTFSIGIVSETSFIPQLSSSSPLYDSMTYLIDAVSISLGARF